MPMFTGTCPECGRTVGLYCPNMTLYRHKPPMDITGHADRFGWCKGSGRWIHDNKPGHAYSGWNGGSV